MRTDNTTHRRRATKMSIGFLSGVTAPAHEGAEAKILKVKAHMTKNQEEGQTLLKSVFTTAVAQRQLQDQVCNILDQLWPLNGALRQSATDIAADDTITDKQGALIDSVNEYIDAFISMAQGVFDSAPATPAVIKNKTVEDDPMSVAELAKYKALAGMNDVTKTYHATLPEDQQEAFLKMDAATQAALVKAFTPAVEVPTGNEESFTAVGSGEIVTKSKAGDNYAFMKSQNEQMETMQKTQAISVAKGIVATEYPDLPGTEEERVDMVLKMQAMPEATRTVFEKQMKQSQGLWKARKAPGAGMQGAEPDVKDAYDKAISDWMAANPKKKRSDAIVAVANTAAGKAYASSTNGGAK